MTLAALFVTLGGLTAAARADETKLYTVIGVPAGDLGSFERANTSPGFDGRLPAVANTVRVLHVSASGVATVSITRKSDPEKFTSRTVYFPVDSSTGTIPPIYQEINPFDSFSAERIVGSGNTAAMLVSVSQADAGKLDLGRSRFMLAPSDQVSTLELMNPRVTFKSVHVQRAAAGGTSMLVALLAIDQDAARGIQIPNEPLARTIAALNSNVAVQQVQGQGFYQITTIAVN
jgi:hypothetical protein